MLKRHKKLQVLLVDDDPIDRQLLKQAFGDASENVEMHQCDNGLKALDFLAQRGEYKEMPPTDACILDINMPGLTGLEVLRRIREDKALRKLHVIMMSNSADQKDIDASYDLNASGYVQKPGSYMELREFVSVIASFWNKFIRFPTHYRAMGQPA